MIRLFIIFSILFCLSACGGSGAVKNNSGQYVSASASSNAVSVSSVASSHGASSLSASSVASVGGLYGLYVSLHMGRADQLLGNAQREETFLTFVRDNGFNYLIFYELEGMAPTSTKAHQFASLVSRAKLSAGVTQVAAALGDASEADMVVAYNDGRTASERIDVLNVEYEFWNKKDRKTEFATTLSMLERFNAVASEHQLMTEIYIGWVDATEAISLANVTDRILVHYYRQNDIDLINFGIERLEWMAAASRKVKVAPIFSAEGPNNTYDAPFMGCWLEKNANQKAFTSWKAQYDALTHPWKENIEIVGATWFVYDKFLDVGIGPENGCTQ
ncbi:hypothetical protein [Cellvibrio sp. UBA7661]|uniref:hypothetical protein n=1 Tax=Cellvibrio sp. UBA7661 TaxID=1946311 RepID=UPI002F35DC9E